MVVLGLRHDVRVSRAYLLPLWGAETVPLILLEVLRLTSAFFFLLLYHPR